MSTDTAVLGPIASLEAVPAHCAALNVSAGGEKYIDGGCVLTDSDGDKIFSTFDARDIDKSQPICIVAHTSSRAAPASPKLSALSGECGLESLACKPVSARRRKVRPQLLMQTGLCRM